MPVLGSTQVDRDMSAITTCSLLSIFSAYAAKPLTGSRTLRFQSILASRLGMTARRIICMTLGCNERRVELERGWYSRQICVQSASSRSAGFRYNREYRVRRFCGSDCEIGGMGKAVDGRKGVKKPDPEADRLEDDSADDSRSASMPAPASDHRVVEELAALDALVSRGKSDLTLATPFLSLQSSQIKFRRPSLLLCPVCRCRYRSDDGGPDIIYKVDFFAP